MSVSTAAVEPSGYSVSVVARRLGVAAATLRTWDRRYGMGPSLRTSGSHRRYTEDDVAVLQRMHGLMATGMHPGDAARAALAGTDPGAAAPDSDPPPARTGNVVELPRGASPRRGLERAAAAMDTNAASDIIRDCIDRNGVAWSWDEVIAPVLRLVGERYAAGGLTSGGIEVEHHLSHVVIREMIRHAEVREPVNPRPVILASAPDEQHTLPLFALAAALAERGIATRVLGSRTPDEALAGAIRKLGPVAVFIWAQSRPTTDLATAVPAIRPAPRLILGGPGWNGSVIPESVARPGHLLEAVSVIAAAARPERM